MRPDVTLSYGQYAVQQNKFLTGGDLPPLPHAGYAPACDMYANNFSTILVNAVHFDYFSVLLYDGLLAYSLST